MNAEQEEKFRQQRVKQAEQIESRVHDFKVCTGCSSISDRAANICPVCHAYCWDEAPESVIATAKYAAKFIFPESLGYAPPTNRSYRPALENDSR